MAHLHNKTNNYADALGELFDKTPKSVFAAIAFSFATCGGDRWQEGAEEILREWWALHESGIVPQKPKLPRPADKEVEIN
jgi:hypothetical protein